MKNYWNSNVDLTFQHRNVTFESNQILMFKSYEWKKLRMCDFEHSFFDEKKHVEFTELTYDICNFL